MYDETFLEQLDNTDPIFITIDDVNAKIGAPESGDTPDSERVDSVQTLKLPMRVDVPVMMRLRESDPPIDIRTVIDPRPEVVSLYDEMHADPRVAVAIAYEATRHADPDPERDPMDFASGLSGDRLGELTRASILAVARFTQDREARRVLLALIDKASKIEQGLRNVAIDSIKAGALDSVNVETLLTSRSSDMRELSGSIHSVPTRSESSNKCTEGETGMSGGGSPLS